MPIETKAAVDWTLSQSIQTITGDVKITPDMADFVVDKVREYFNTNHITYHTFSYDNLKAFL